MMGFFLSAILSSTTFNDKLQPDGKDSKEDNLSHTDHHAWLKCAAVTRGLLVRHQILHTNAISPLLQFHQ